ncbi:DUF6711 family protein [Clostridium perfringens]|uniref:DUF6711 family protein n=1 Tax=Clostridium perfringens TaxID=1502 RepID=UPI000F528E6A|nr:DUF6711 family protein [Clostridium perfringens]CAJ1869690.1 hypothetical protein AUSP0004_00011 [uncultured phage]EJT5924480.1 hypothetical protein [Clostridium perfringens]MDM0478839.1 hypothetical protein [Clostridium perfringens]MDM0486662.1 hypothetical protein [Clostridium perfringens]HBI6980263.1 hypothetical protein [Clostridium perfringens]
MLVINGVEIATPKTFQVDINDIDGETNRNAKGEMLRDRIATKRKLNCEWPPLNEYECSELLKAVKDIFFQVTYPDPMEGRALTKTFYVGDRNIPALAIVNGEVIWKGLKMNFIEK